MVVNKTMRCLIRLRRFCVQKVLAKSRWTTFAQLVVLTLTGILLVQIGIVPMPKPYYLVDDPKYVFIDNDHDDKLLDQFAARPACSPYNTPLIENVRVIVDNRIYPQVLPLNQNRHFNFTCLNSSAHRPLILVWNRFGGIPIMEIPDGPLHSPNCPVNNCEITKDRNRLNESSYVLFHMRSSIDGFPKYRFSRQKWVYLIYESPQNCAMCTRFDGFFNLSATYRYLRTNLKKLSVHIF